MKSLWLGFSQQTRQKHLSCSTRMYPYLPHLANDLVSESKSSKGLEVTLYDALARRQTPGPSTIKWPKELLNGKSHT
jgi:hypothetical protein